MAPLRPARDFLPRLRLALAAMAVTLALSAAIGEAGGAGAIRTTDCDPVSDPLCESTSDTLQWAIGSQACPLPRKRALLRRGWVLLVRAYVAVSEWMTGRAIYLQLIHTNQSPQENGSI